MSRSSASEAVIAVASCASVANTASRSTLPLNPPLAPVTSNPVAEAATLDTTPSALGMVTVPPPFERARSLPVSESTCISLVSSLSRSSASEAVIAVVSSASVAKIGSRSTVPLNPPFVPTKSISVPERNAFETTPSTPPDARIVAILVST